MASQLLVKSEVAQGWDGTAIWIVQDVLTKYITASTGLTVENFRSQQSDEVNILSFSYGDLGDLKDGVLPLGDADLFAGAITTNTGSFSDIIRTPLRPPRSKLMQALTQRRWDNKIIAGA
jgi:hypothetical protein